MVRFDSWGRLCDRNYDLLDEDVVRSLLPERAAGESEFEAALRLGRLWADPEHGDWLAGEGEAVDASYFDHVDSCQHPPGS